jgi:hypothetical protein
MALDAKSIKLIIEAHIKRAAIEHPSWDADRALYRCENWGAQERNGKENQVSPDSELYTESGAMYAYTDTMVAAVVPTNPQVTGHAREAGFVNVAK